MEKIPNAVYMGWNGRFHPDVVPAPVNGASSPCGENRKDSSTGLSTKRRGRKSYPHLGCCLDDWLYMGVGSSRCFRSALDLSTAKGSYPQIIAGYPQFRPSRHCRVRTRLPQIWSPAAGPSPTCCPNITKK